jgi:cytochrome P450
MSSGTLLERLRDPATRPNPYPLFEELRQSPVVIQDDGSFMLGRYREVRELLHDPRLSSDESNRIWMEGDPPQQAGGMGLPPTLIRSDPPDHDRLRRLQMRPFGPPHSPRRIESLRASLQDLAHELIDGLVGETEIDVVERVSYPLPVSAICRVLGVPHEDEPKFHTWAEAIVASAGTANPLQGGEDDPRRALAIYMAGLVEARKNEPKDDMISGLVHDDDPEGPIAPGELIVGTVLLLVAGHETTVNLISNGMLTLLRNPELFDELRADPSLYPTLIEEVLRFEPPIQMLPQRTPVSDIVVAGTTIPKGAHIELMLASANRDPERFPDPERFIPGRRNNEHLGFGSGIHSCFGAPLARLEGQFALRALVERLDNPRLVEDPPPYRPSPVLRGPRHLRIEVDGVRPRS